MKGLHAASLVILAHAVFVFLLGIPPFSHVAYHYFTTYHPVARQLKVVNTVNAAQTTEALGTALTLGIFDILQTPSTALEVAEALNLPVRGVEPLLEVLAAADYLYVDGRKYYNSATAQHHLVSGLEPQDDMGALVRLMTTFPGRGTLTESVQRGGTALNDHAETDSNKWWETFAQVTSPMMSNCASDMAKLLQTMIDDDDKSHLQVLDIAAGSGAYGFAVVNKFSSAHVVQNDYDNVLKVTEQNAVDQGIDKDRIEFARGSFFEAEFDDSSFDVVLAPNILHHFSEGTALTFFEKVHRILKPGGHLLIVEICRPETPYSIWEGPSTMPRTFSMTMLMWTIEGKAYSVSEMKEVLKAANFDNAKLAGTSFPNSCFVTASKPK